MSKSETEFRKIMFSKNTTVLQLLIKDATTFSFNFSQQTEVLRPGQIGVVAAGHVVMEQKFVTEVARTQLPLTMGQNALVNGIRQRVVWERLAQV